MGYTTYDLSESLKKVELIVNPSRVLYAYGKNGDYAEWDGAFLIELEDGKIALLSGWCDTTGWGCQDGAELQIVDTLGEIVWPQETSWDRDEPTPRFPPLATWDKDPADLNRWLAAGRPDPWEWEDDAP